MAGACVHCKTPVMAVERAGEVVMVLADSQKPDQSESSGPQQPVAKKEQPEEVEEPVEVPPPLMPGEPLGEVDWGFPDKEPKKEVLPPLDPPAATDTASSGISLSSALPDPGEEIEEKIPSLSDDTQVTLDFSKGEEDIQDLGFSNVEQTNKAEVIEEPESKSEFEDKSASLDNLFGDLEKPPSVQSGWGTGIPKQSHASMSPFATGSADATPGFAETLFREKGNEPAAPSEMASNSLNMTASPAPVSEPAASPEPEGFGSYDSSKLGASEVGELPPMTKEQEEEFAKGMRTMHQSRRSPFMKRLTRFVIVGAIIGGAGYAAMIFLPEETVNKFKTATDEWLAPAKELMADLPFGFGKGEEGEEGGGFKIDAIEGLKTFSDEYDEYQKQSADQLGTEVEEGPMEKRIPEMPFGLGGKKAE